MKARGLPVVTRREEEAASERAFRRSMAVDALEELLLKVAPGYDETDHRHLVEQVVDACIDAARA